MPSRTVVDELRDRLLARDPKVVAAAETNTERLRASIQAIRDVRRAFSKAHGTRLKRSSLGDTNDT